MFRAVAIIVKIMTQPNQHDASSKKIDSVVVLLQKVNKFKS